MPDLSVWFIRTAFVHFSIGITAGTLIFLNKSFLIDHRLWTFLPVHIELLLAGWILNLVMGVAYWILPRLQEGSLRGNEKIVWTAFILLNAGVLITAFGELALPDHSSMLIGRTMEFLAAPLFASQVWRRVYSIRDLV